MILETLTALGAQQIMAQAYLPAIKDGDKRILMIDGSRSTTAWRAFRPAAKPVATWLPRGARRERARDRWIAAQVGPTLRERPVVRGPRRGDYLTEINVTSPTCIREIDNAYNTDIGGKLMDAIDRQLQAR